MLTLLQQDDRLRALGAGLGYVVLSALLAHTRWYVATRLTKDARHPQRALHRWHWGSELAGLVLAAGYPALMAMTGVFSPADIGLHEPDWSSVLPVLVIGTLVSSAWLALLWWQKRMRPRAERSGEAASTWSSSDGPIDPCAFSLMAAVQDEGRLATCRAALVPVLGTIWGVWLAVILRMLSSTTSPRQQMRLREASQRPGAYLDWALDWISTAVFVLTQTIVATLIMRVLCRTLLDLTVLRPAVTAARSQDEGTHIDGYPETRSDA